MEAFNKFLVSKIDISDAELKYITSLMQPKEFSKNVVVLRQGEVEKYLYFIEKGMARYYYVDHNGREICLLFTFENWFMGEVTSFLTRTPSVCFIETLANTSTWRIHFDDLQKIYANTKSGDKFGRLMMEQLYLRKAERERSFLTKTAQQRYIDLMKTESHIFQKVSLKHIASYLGITPQALSRIRKRIN